MILAEDHPVATASNATPRYRYYEEAPKTVSLPACELVERLPGEIRRRGALTEESEGEESRMVEIPSADLLSGKIPKIALGRLQELLPDLVQVPSGRDLGETITLPPGWIALHFRMVTHREELAPERVAEESKGSQLVKAIEPVHVEEVTDADTLNKEEQIAEVIEVVTVADGVTAEVMESANKADKPSESSKAPAPAQVAESTPARRKGLFESLPIFRRRHAPEVTTESEPVIKNNDAAAPSSVIDKLPVTSSKALAVERLWKLDPQDKLADPSPLQALFMTEEKLTLESVISKAGQLPGLNACVLAHGDQVLCTSNATTGVDLRTLSAQAMTMLAQIRETSANMGLGAVPAVTLHAEHGALSFLHNGELCLLVLHGDRGFVPGVRERLQQMLGHLAEAKPALPAPGIEP